jgi:hypothetical protein
MNNIMCIIFGHKVDPTDMLIAQLKVSAINKHELDHRLKCSRCHVELLQGRI